jgi:hypothetical protein
VAASAPPPSHRRDPRGRSPLGFRFRFETRRRARSPLPQDLVNEASDAPSKS